MRKKKDRSGEHLAFHPDEFYQMLSHLKRCFSRGKVVKEVLKKVRSTEPRYKSDGRLHKSPSVRYTCNDCNNKFPSTQVQCDHIESVVPLQVPAVYMSLGVLARRIFVTPDKIQVLCKLCHNKKSQLENEERRKWADKVKYIIYMTTNKLNNRFYIGVHKCIDLSDGYLGSGKALKLAISKYGKENFIREVLEVYTTAKEAYDAEREIVNTSFIETNESESYNLVTGGNGTFINPKPMLGKTHSLETRKKIGSRRYGKGKDCPASKKIYCVQTGEVFDTIGDAIIKYGKGRFTRALKEGYPCHGYNWRYVDDVNPPSFKVIKGPSKKVKCNETGEIFNSAKEAAFAKNGKCSSSIGMCCKGQRKTALNHTWSFVDNY